MSTTHTTDAGLDTISPATHPARDATHFRAIIAARKAAEDADTRLLDAVRSARSVGDSWTVIAAALDTTRQAAQQRFAKHINTPD